MKSIVVVDRLVVILFFSLFADHCTAFVETMKSENRYVLAQEHCTVERSLEIPNCIQIQLV